MSDLGPRPIGDILPDLLSSIVDRAITYHAGRAADPKLSPAEREAAARECELFGGTARHRDTIPPRQS